MAKNIIEEVNKEVKKTLAWVGTEIVNLQSAGKKLEGINLTTIREDPKAAERQARSVRQDITTYAGRSEMRAGREEYRLAKALDELLKALPQEDKGKVEPLIKEITRIEGLLKVFASRYTGETKKAFDAFPEALKSLAIAKQIADKDPGNKNAKAAAEVAYKSVVVVVKKVKAKVAEVIKWNLGLDVDLKNLQTFLAKMQAKYLRAA